MSVPPALNQVLREGRGLRAHLNSKSSFFARVFFLHSRTPGRSRCACCVQLRTIWHLAARVGSICARRAAINSPRSLALRAFPLLCARTSTANLLRVSARFCFPCARCHEPCATFYVFYGVPFFVYSARAISKSARAVAWLCAVSRPIVYRWSSKS